jgi:hypothetical protein
VNLVRAHVGRHYRKNQEPLPPAYFADELAQEIEDLLNTGFVRDVAIAENTDASDDLRRAAKIVVAKPARVFGSADKKNPHKIFVGMFRGDPILVSCEDGISVSQVRRLDWTEVFDVVRSTLGPVYTEKENHDNAVDVVGMPEWRSE